jgi:hypothetical protein
MNQEEKNIQDDPVYSRKVLEMITVANEYCHFLEKSSEYPLTEFLGFLQKILPLLYLKASLLPDIQVTDEGATEHYVTEEEWEGLFNELRQKLAESDIYHHLDHDRTNNAEPIKGSIAESITDIYQDLKDFLLLYQKPLKIYKECAVRDCKNLFETRYGYRILDSLTAVHNHIYQAGETEPDY